MEINTSRGYGGSERDEESGSNLPNHPVPLAQLSPDQRDPMVKKLKSGIFITGFIAGCLICYLHLKML